MNTEKKSNTKIGLIMGEESLYSDYKSNRKQKQIQRFPFPLKKTTIDRIIYPVYTKRGIKYGKKRATTQEK
jgi:hypothetical protein